MPVKHLSATRNVKDFFSKLRKNDLINYHPGKYTATQVCDIGRDYGWHIEYCDASTDHYKKYGCFICLVIDVLPHNQRLIQPIDPSKIATNFKGSWVNKEALRKYI